MPSNAAPGVGRLTRSGSPRRKPGRCDAAPCAATSGWWLIPPRRHIRRIGRRAGVDRRLATAPPTGIDQPTHRVRIPKARQRYPTLRQSTTDNAPRSSASPARMHPHRRYMECGGSPPLWLRRGVAPAGHPLTDSPQPGANSLGARSLTVASRIGHRATQHPTDQSAHRPSCLTIEVMMIAARIPRPCEDRKESEPPRLDSRRVSRRPAAGPTRW